MRNNVPMRTRLAATAAALFSMWASAAHAGDASEQRLEVFATVSNLAALARAVGGDAVSVTTMVPPTEDPHFAEPRPSFIKALHEADLLLVVGLDAEAGYLNVLLDNARNARVLPGKPGYVVAAAAITPLGRPTGTVSRAMGDVHPLGNPHFLVDPVRGLAVAGLIRDRMSDLLPERADHFTDRYEKLVRRIGDALVGHALHEKYDATKLARLYSAGKLESFLQSQGDRDALGGWLGRMMPYGGTPVVDDHDMWPYFAERFGIRIVDHLEPLPGIQPTTRHLKEVVERMRADDVRVLIQSPYYDPRHARFIAEQTGAHIARLAHQVGAVPEARDYADMIDYNVRTLADTIGATR